MHFTQLSWHLNLDQHYKVNRNTEHSADVHVGMSKLVVLKDSPNSLQNKPLHFPELPKPMLMRAAASHTQTMSNSLQFHSSNLKIKESRKLAAKHVNFVNAKKYSL